MEYDLFGNIIEERIPRPKQKNIKNITKDLHGLADNGFEGYEANDEELIALYEAVESLHLRLNEIQNLKKAVENNGFSKQISFKNEETGKKTVIEKSWFKRGNKIIVTGIRRGDMFIGKKYKSTPYHFIELIEEVNEDGTAITRGERLEV